MQLFQIGERRPAAVPNHSRLRDAVSVERLRKKGRPEAAGDRYAPRYAPGSPLPLPTRPGVLYFYSALALRIAAPARLHGAWQA